VSDFLRGIVQALNHPVSSVNDSADMIIKMFDHWTEKDVGVLVGSLIHLMGITLPILFMTIVVNYLTMLLCYYVIPICDIM